MVVVPGIDERIPIVAAVVASVLLHAWALVLPRWQDPHPVEPPAVLTVELRTQPLPIAFAPALPGPSQPEDETPAVKQRPKPEPAPARPLPRPRSTVLPQPKPPVPVASQVPAAPVPVEAPPAAAVPSATETRPPAEAVERRAAAVAAPAAVPMTPPSLNAAYLRNPAPRYPSSARRNGEEGTVLLRVAVTVEGAAARVDLERSSGSPALDEAAAAAVRNWRFVPARRGGEAVEAVVVVPVVFKLSEGG